MQVEEVTFGDKGRPRGLAHRLVLAVDKTHFDHQYFMIYSILYQVFIYL